MQKIMGSAINSMIVGSNYFCSLCFKTVVDNAIHVEDKVIVMHHDHDRTYDEVFMTDILSKILGPKFEDQLSIFNAICNQCSSAAISSYKFLIKCQDNSQKIYNIIDSLTKGTEKCLTNIKNSKAAFVSVNTENFEYNGLNSKTTANHRQRAYRKFLNLLLIPQIEDLNLLHKTQTEDLNLLHKTQTEDLNLLHKTQTEDLNCNRNPDSKALCKDKVLQVKLVKLKPYVFTNGRVVVCTVCDKYFCRRNSLNEHYKRFHVSQNTLRTKQVYTRFYVSQNTQCTKRVNFSGSELIPRTQINHSVVLKYLHGTRDLYEILSLDNNPVHSKRVPHILKHSLKKRSIMNKDHNYHETSMTTN